MSERRSLLALGERPVLEPLEEPVAHRRPIVVVVDRWAREVGGLADALSAALSSESLAVARLSLVLRQSEGHARDGDQLRASLDRMPSAFADALDTLPPHDVLLLEGPAALALTRPRLAILGAPASLLAWPPDVRAVRSRFDLVLFAPRPPVLGLLARALAG